MNTERKARFADALVDRLTGISDTCESLISKLKDAQNMSDDEYRKLLNDMREFFVASAMDELTVVNEVAEHAVNELEA